MTNSNSIRMNLTANSVENEIRLLLSVPKNKYATMVLLEGIDDIKLFFSLVNNENTYLFESYGGKLGIKNILSKFTSDYRVIGIADRDYETKNIPKLFYCDYCNAEMMIASTHRLRRRRILIDFELLNEQSFLGIILARKRLIFQRKDKCWGEKDGKNRGY